MYDQACYQRRKNKIIKKSSGEEFIAYKKIRDKWGFDDFRIRDLLRNYTVSEILEGTLDDGKFTPKELLYLDSLMQELGKTCCKCKKTIVYIN